MIFNFNHLKEANSNYFHHLKYSGICTLYSGLIFLLSIVHTIFPFIGDWHLIKLTSKMLDIANVNFNINSNTIY